MRPVFCGKYRPLSGPGAAALSWSSDVYPVSWQKMLPAGHAASASPSIEAALIELARAKRILERGSFFVFSTAGATDTGDLAESVGSPRQILTTPCRSDGAAERDRR
jgi:hypothetical protein